MRYDNAARILLALAPPNCRLRRVAGVIRGSAPLASNTRVRRSECHLAGSEFQPPVRTTWPASGLTGTKGGVGDVLPEVSTSGAENELQLMLEIAAQRPESVSQAGSVRLAHAVIGRPHECLRSGCRYCHMEPRQRHRLGERRAAPWPRACRDGHRRAVCSNLTRPLPCFACCPDCSSHS